MKRKTIMIGLFFVLVIVEGLIHISELSDKRVNHPKEVVQEGQWLTLRVIRVEPDKRRLGLSLRRVTHGEYMDEDWRSALAEANTEEGTPPAESSPPAEEPPV